MAAAKDRRKKLIEPGKRLDRYAEDLGAGGKPPGGWLNAPAAPQAVKSFFAGYGKLVASEGGTVGRLFLPENEAIVPGDIAASALNLAISRPYLLVGAQMEEGGVREVFISSHKRRFPGPGDRAARVALAEDGKSALAEVSRINAPAKGDQGDKRAEDRPVTVPVLAFAYNCLAAATQNRQLRLSSEATRVAQAQLGLIEP